jgi:hypothetical protein
MMIDGIELKGSTNVVALGITTEGVKIPLGLWKGSTENATVLTALLSDLVDRGLDPKQGIPFGIDGAKAIRAVFGERAVVQRCVRHKERNLLDHLPERDRPVVKRRLRCAGNSEPDPGRGSGSPLIGPPGHRSYDAPGIRSSRPCRTSMPERPSATVSLSKARGGRSCPVGGTRMIRRTLEFGRQRWLVLASLSIALVGAGGVAMAAIPDGGGTIHGCYTSKGGLLRVIDTAKGQACLSGEVPLSWSQTGPAGPTGRRATRASLELPGSPTGSKAQRRRMSSSTGLKRPPSRS